MPGVIITTSARSGPTPSEPNASGQAFIVGLAERGSGTEAVLVRGLADFEAKFGGRVSYSYLHDTVKTFFDEGGTQAYIARVVGAAATTGKVTVSNGDDEPTPAIEVSASSPGAWSEGLTVEITEGSIAGTVNVLVHLNGQTVRTFNSVGTLDQLISRVNGDGTYVTVRDMGSTSRALPAVGTYEVSAGADDRTSIVADDHAKALDRFADTMGDGAVFAVDASGIDEALVEHAEKNSRIALLFNQDKMAGINDLAGLPDSDAAGMFFPWIRVGDNGGNVRDIPPVGYVAGVRNRAHTQVGAWRPPAGEIAASRSIVGLTREFSRAEADLLDEARISVIRRIANTVRLYGWRSLSSDVDNFGYLSGRDLLNRVVVEASRRLEQFVFAPVDAKGQLLSTINSELVGILEPIRLAGGLYPLTNDDGEEVDDGYLVDTSNAVNTRESLSRNEVHASVSLRVSPIGALILLEITKVGLRQAL